MNTRKLQVIILVLTVGIIWGLVFTTRDFITKDFVVHADDFARYNDAYYCHFAPVVGMFYDKSFIEHIDGNKIIFNRDAVRGLDSSYIRSYTIHDLANIYAGHVSRYNKALHVALPPGAKIDIGFWGYNYAGHDINIKKIYIPLDLVRNEQEVGDITNIVDFEYNVLNIKYRNQGQWRNRTSKFLVVNPTHFEYATNRVYKGDLIASGVVKQNMYVTHIETECLLNKTGEQQVNVYMNLSNKASFGQRVKFNNKVYTIPARVTRRITYMKSIPTGVKYFNPPSFYVAILDSKTECSSLSHPNAFINNPLYKQTFVLRDDIGSKRDFWGIQPGLTSNKQGYTKTFCVTRIPYTIKIKPPSCQFPSGVDITMKQNSCMILEHFNKVNVVIQNKGILLKNLKFYIKGENALLDFSHPLQGIHVNKKDNSLLEVFIDQIAALKTMSIPIEIKPQNKNVRISVYTNTLGGVIRSITIPNLKFCNPIVKSSLILSPDCELERLTGKHVLGGKSSYNMRFVGSYPDLQDILFKQELNCNFKIDNLQKVKVYADICTESGCVSVRPEIEKYSSNDNNAILTIKINKALKNIKSLKIESQLTLASGKELSEGKMSCTIVQGIQGYTTLGEFQGGVIYCSNNESKSGGQVFDSPPLGDNKFKDNGSSTPTSKKQIFGKQSYLFDNLVSNISDIRLLRKLQPSKTVENNNYEILNNKNKAKKANGIKKENSSAVSFVIFVDNYVSRLLVNRYKLLIKDVGLPHLYVYFANIGVFVIFLIYKIFSKFKV